MRQDQDNGQPVRGVGCGYVLRTALAVALGILLAAAVGVQGLVWLGQGLEAQLQDGQVVEEPVE